MSTAHYAALDTVLLRGVAWIAGAKWVAQIGIWASTIVVARLLSPADYGLVNMAAVFVGLGTLVTALGVETAIVALRDVDEETLAQMNTVAIVVGAATMTLAMAAAFAVGQFYSAPELPRIILATSVTLLLGGIRAVPAALLKRGMRFRRAAKNDAAQSIIRAAVTLLFALIGWHYWALIGGLLVGSVLSTALTVVASPCRMARPHLRSLRGITTVSWRLVGREIGWTVSQEGDFVVAGRALGQQALGFYTLAWTLASAPIEKVSDLVFGVTPAILSSVQHDVALLRRYFLVITQALATIMMPATIGLALVGGDLVASVLGDKWSAAVAPLQLLAAYGTIRSVMPLLTQVLVVMNDTRYTMLVEIVGAIVLPAAFYVGSYWGVVGIATSWLIVHPVVVVIPMARRVLKRLELSLWEYVRTFEAPVVSTLVMCTVVLLSGFLPGMRASARWALLLKIALGASSYALALWTGYRSQVLAVWRLGRRARAEADITAHASGAVMP